MCPVTLQGHGGGAGDVQGEVGWGLEHYSEKTRAISHTRGESQGSLVVFDPQAFLRESKKGGKKGQNQAAINARFDSVMRGDFGTVLALLQVHISLNC